MPDLNQLNDTMIKHSSLLINLDIDIRSKIIDEVSRNQIEIAIFNAATMVETILKEVGKREFEEKFKPKQFDTVYLMGYISKKFEFSREIKQCIEDINFIRNIYTHYKSRHLDHVMSMDGHCQEVMDNLAKVLTWYAEDYFISIEMEETQENVSPQSPPDKKKDRLIGRSMGKYKIIDRIGKGGIGIIYQAWDPLEESFKAIKIISRTLGKDTTDLSALKKEIKAASKITHENVVRVMGLEEHKGTYFIVMEYISGRTLGQIMGELKNKRFDEFNAIRYMTKVAMGLHQAHKKGVIHLDIKPQNIMISDENEVKVLDFSISYEASKTFVCGLTGRKTPKYVGTLPYMAPEQLSEKHGNIDQQTDVWEFGATLHNLLTGVPPFHSEKEILDPHFHLSPIGEISPEAQALIDKCLTRDRKERYNNFDEILKDLFQLSKILLEKLNQKKGVKPKKKKESPPPSSNTPPEETQLLENTKNWKSPKPKKKQPTSKIPETPHPPIIPKVNLRSIAVYLEPSDITQIVKANGFYERSINPVKKFTNQFVVLNIDYKEIILDERTNLLWFKEGSLHSPKYLNAYRYVHNLNVKRFAGYDDWRVPTMEEAASLLAPQNPETGLFLEPIFSPHQQTIFAADLDPTEANWIINFITGRIHVSTGNLHHFVRPVRSL